MGWLAVLEQPWCFAGMLVLVILLLLGGALVAREQRAQHLPAEVGFPSAHYPAKEVANAAPMEALAALQGRLQELLHHLPPGSDDAHWLGAFLHELRTTMDVAYQRLENTAPQHRPELLHRLQIEVAALATVVNIHLQANLSRRTDREALDAQLSAIRRTL